MRRTLIAIFSVLSLLLGLQVASSSANAPERSDYIVKFFDNANLDQELAALERSSFQPSRVFRAAFKGGVFSMTEAQAQALSRNPKVEIVEKDQEVSISATQNSNLPWGLDRIDRTSTDKLNGSYEYATEGSGVTAYVIDTGIRTTHTQFESRARWGTNTVDRRNEDCNGHGTHVAGTIGGKDFGVAKKVILVAVKVLNCQGSGTWSGVIAGMDWVIGNHLDSTPAVANMSLGGGKSLTVNAAATSLVADNVVLAVAAGNDGLDAKDFSPASADGVITVGATNSSDTRASWSNFGNSVEIFAPGVNILSSWVSGKSNTATTTISGTSMASPHVAGAAARLLSSSWASETCAQVTISGVNVCPASAVRTFLISSATTGQVVSGGTGSPNLLLYIEPIR
jgi:subtilisin family serine protease